MRDLAVLLLFVAMIPAAIRATHVGAMMWAWVALVAPNAFVYGFAAGIPYNKVVVGITMLSLVFGKFKNRFYVDRTLVVLTLFVIIIIISYLFGLATTSRTYDLTDRMVKIYALCLVMVASLQTRLQIHGMVLAVCFGLGIFGVLEGLKYLSSGGGHQVIGPASIGDNNQFGLAVLMVIPLLIYVYRYADHRVARLALLGAVGLNLVAVVATASRGALIGLVAIGIAMTLRSKRKAASLTAMAVVGCLIVAFAPARWTERMDTISEANEDGSFMSRVSSWKLNAVLAVERPFGAGPSGLEDRNVFEAYRSKVNSTISFFPVAEPRVVLAAHSIYFQALGDTGFLGLGVFVAMLVVGFANLRDVRRLTKGREELGWAADLSTAMYVSMIAYIVAGAALSMVYFELFYILLTLTAVLRHQVRRAVLAPATTPAAAAPARFGALAGVTGRSLG